MMHGPICIIFKHSVWWLFKKMKVLQQNLLFFYLQHKNQWTIVKISIKNSKKVSAAFSTAVYLWCAAWQLSCSVLNYRAIYFTCSVHEILGNIHDVEVISLYLFIYFRFKMNSNVIYFLCVCVCVCVCVWSYICCMYIFHSSLNWYMITETLHEAQLKRLSHLSLPSI